jgi:hypothetical protein
VQFGGCFFVQEFLVVPQGKGKLLYFNAVGTPICRKEREKLKDNHYWLPIRNGLLVNWVDGRRLGAGIAPGGNEARDDAVDHLPLGLLPIVSFRQTVQPPCAYLIPGSPPAAARWSWPGWNHEHSNVSKLQFESPILKIELIAIQG